MQRDRLFVFQQSFVDPERPGMEPWFCPYSAQVIGFLSYYPEVRATLDVHELDFAKPRHALVDVLGEALQAAPMLVLHAGAPAEGVTIAEANGHRYVAKTLKSCATSR